MSAAQRLLLYLAALLALVALLVSLTLLAREVVALGASNTPLVSILPRLAFGPVALWFWLALLALLLWAVSWSVADQAAQPLTMAGAAERGSAARKAYLWLGQAAALAVLLVQGVGLIRNLVLSPGLVAGPWLLNGLSLTAGAMLALVFWAFLRWAALRDEDLGQESGPAASWRRLYFYGAASAGLALLAIGSAELVRLVLALAVGSGIGASFRGALALPLSLALVGVPVLGFAMSTANQLAADAPKAELHALSRKLFLYGWSSLAGLTTLFCLAYLVRYLLLFLLNMPHPPDRWLVSAPSYLIAGAVTWSAVEAFVRDDVVRLPENCVAATVRQVARYGMAAVALAALAYGLTEMGRLMALAAVGIEAEPAPVRFATAAALILVGAPSWWGFVWPQQVRARAEGQATLPRQLYLGGVVLVTGVLALWNFVRFVYEALTGRGLVTTLADRVPVIGLLSLWLVAHWLVLRGDRQLAGQTNVAGPVAPEVARPPNLPAPMAVRLPAMPHEFPRSTLPVAGGEGWAEQGAPRRAPLVAVLDGGDGALGAALLPALRRAAPEVQLWPVGLNAAAQIAMLDALGGQAAAPLPLSALAQANVIVGPTDILMPGGLDGDVSQELAALLMESSARKLLLPPRDAALRWVAAPDWPAARWIENAVIEVLNCLA